MALNSRSSCVYLLKAGITRRLHYTQTHLPQTVIDHARCPVQQQSFSKQEHFALLHFFPQSWLIWIMKTYFVLTCIFPGDNEGKHLMGPWNSCCESPFHVWGNFLWGFPPFSAKCRETLHRQQCFIFYSHTLASIFSENYLYSSFIYIIVWRRSLRLSGALHGSTCL